MTHVQMPPDDRCAECGAVVANGQSACQLAFERLSAGAFGEVGDARAHRLVVDAFCMQRVLPYARSAKSYAAHLAGLCCGVEQNGDLAIHAAIQRWLSGSTPPELLRPSPPVARGAMTVHDIAKGVTSTQRVASVETWARLVWDAYAEQQALARQWVHLAQRTFGRRR